MDFEWDEAKSRRNATERGLPFDLAFSRSRCSMAPPWSGPMKASSTVKIERLRSAWLPVAVWSASTRGAGAMRHRSDASSPCESPPGEKGNCMKKRSRSRVDPATFDWSKHDATTDRHVRRQIADDPDTAPELTPAQATRARAVHPPASIDVQRIRRRLGLSQAAFASRYGFRTRTVQEWEQRRRRPEGPARILLRVIEREPEAIERALKGL